METLLALERIVWVRGAARLLDDVSTSFAAGRCTAIVGANGAGKTSLLRVAAGWTDPTSGVVRLDGRPLGEWDRRAAARRIAVVGAEDDLSFPLRVEDVVALGRHPWRTRFGKATDEDRAHLERALAACDLLALRTRAAATLSSGERQRMQWARALAQNPAVLLVDEAAAHLDWAQRQRLLEVLRDEAAVHARSVVAVLHDLDAAAGWADRALLLHRGRIVAAGPPNDVLVPSLLEPAFGLRVESIAVGDGRRVLLPAPSRRAAGDR